MTRKRKFLLASVLALQNLNFIYPSCQKCFSRIILGSKRCTQDPSKIPETLDSGIIRDLLAKAVEACFVGQSFIFGVTNFENQCGHGSDSSDFLQRCRDLRRGVRALVACQIILPDPRAAGFPVIDCFHQFLQTSSLRRPHCGSQEPSSQLLSLGHSSSDLSSIHDPNSPSSFVESWTRENVSRFWHLSLELTSAVSQLTDKDDLSVSEQSLAVGTPHQTRKCPPFAKMCGSSDCRGSSQSSWRLVSYMDRRSTPKKSGKELAIQGHRLSIVQSSYHKTRITNSNLFPLKMQDPLEGSSVVSITNTYSPDELPCYQHHDVDSSSCQEMCTCCCSLPLLRSEEVANGSQDSDPVVWDDLPLSESLDKFLAFVESEIAKTPRDGKNRKHNIDDDIDKSHTDCTRLSLSPQRTTGALQPPPSSSTSLQATHKANCTTDNFLSHCRANQGSSIEKEPQPVNPADAVSISSNVTAETVSTSSSGRGVSQHCLPEPCLSPRFLFSEDLKTVTLKTVKVIPHRDKISLTPSTSENDHYLGIKYFSECGEKSLSEVNERLTASYSKTYSDVSDLCKLENKHCMWPKSQHDRFTICRKLTYPLETLCSSPDISTNVLKEMTCGQMDNNLTQSSPGHESSYDASADLFGDIAKDTEITKKSKDFSLQWETSLADNLGICAGGASPENHLKESGFSLNSAQSSQKLSLQSISAFRYPRTCSPLHHLQSDLECDLEDSQNFVPCSQSTPVTGLGHTRTRRMYGFIKKLPTLSANYNKTQISPENGIQQAIPSCLQNIKIHSKKSRSPVVPALTQAETFMHCTVAECVENDAYECVPPTTTKGFCSDALGFQVLGFRKRLTAHNSPEQREVPRKKLKHVKQRTDTYLIKKKLNNMFTARGAKQKAPKYNCKNSGQISRRSVFGVDSFSENELPAMSETKSAWSPELFS
ncbi:DNA damage-induced apoptosis suppressor protein isoform X2 [Octodon degus]|uniref:DNA damage-induced apoptosis suppressor protein isoform X2 n=1 Tax=Octodon degus TaxID=10160 RepID=A0A6P6EK73_OCTDE|nr:DNA damage-induced apoptosis suppressor protein isoform X2 [Octodon degus]